MSPIYTYRCPKCKDECEVQGRINGDQKPVYCVDHDKPVRMQRIMSVPQRPIIRGG